MPYNIIKTKKGYHVTLVARNGEILSTSEVIKTKANCFKNIVSQLVAARGDGVVVDSKWKVFRSGVKIKMI